MSTVSVSKITAHNYKNIRLGNGIDFGPLNIFIGPNGSGKSNVISLLQFLQESKKTQIIVSTHSPDLLDHFTDQLDECSFIYIFEHDKDSQNHFTPKRLDRHEIAGWLGDGWQLGDLYRVGNPAVGGWPW